MPYYEESFNFKWHKECFIIEKTLSVTKNALLWRKLYYKKKFIMKSVRLSSHPFIDLRDSIVFPWEFGHELSTPHGANYLAIPYWVNHF